MQEREECGMIGSMQQPSTLNCPHAPATQNGRPVPSLSLNLEDEIREKMHNTYFTSQTTPNRDGICEPLEAMFPTGLRRYPRSFVACVRIHFIRLRSRMQLPQGETCTFWTSEFNRGVVF